MRISQIYCYSVVLLTKKYEPHNQRNPYSSSDSINAGLGSKYDPNNAKLFLQRKRQISNKQRVSMKQHAILLPLTDRQQHSLTAHVQQCYLVTQQNRKRTFSNVTA